MALKKKNFLRKIPTFLLCVSILIFSLISSRLFINLRTPSHIFWSYSYLQNLQFYRCLGTMFTFSITILFTVNLDNETKLFIHYQCFFDVRKNSEVILLSGFWHLTLLWLRSGRRHNSTFRLFEVFRSVPVKDKFWNRRLYGVAQAIRVLSYKLMHTSEADKDLGKWVLQQSWYY